MNNEEKEELTQLCKKIAAQVAPKVVDFIPNPVATAENQRSQFIVALAKNLELPHYRKLINLGMKAINDAVELFSPEKQQAILDLFTTYLGSMADSNMPAIIKSKEKEGLIDLATAFGMSTESLNLINDIGMDCINQGKWAEAAGVFALLCQWQHLNSGHWFHQALSCYYSEEPEQALSCIEVAIQLNENQPEFYILQAALALTLSDPELASQSLIHANELIEKHSLILTKEWLDWKEALINKSS